MPSCIAEKAIAGFVEELLWIQRWRRNDTHFRLQRSSLFDGKETIQFFHLAGTFSLKFDFTPSYTISLNNDGVNNFDIYT